jgi:hypothetical protein
MERSDKGGRGREERREEDGTVTFEGRSEESVELGDREDGIEEGREASSTKEGREGQDEGGGEKEENNRGRKRREGVEVEGGLVTVVMAWW